MEIQKDQQLENAQRLADLQRLQEELQSWLYHGTKPVMEKGQIIELSLTSEDINLLTATMNEVVAELRRLLQEG